LLSRAAAGGRFSWHNLVEQRPLAFTVLVVLAVVAGGIVELLPGIMLHKEVPVAMDGSLAVKPYTALELEGRDVYVSEGCYVCHSQMIRPFRSEKLRYGEPSRIEESMWDHPFQWGSKRTGPDLAREGVTRADVLWHYRHMLDPRATSPGSNMPAYPWLLTASVDTDSTGKKLKVMQRLGVPYSEAEVQGAKPAYEAQANTIVAGLATQGANARADSKLVALIGYLMRLGKNQVPVGTASSR
jgi:cytochrome c oxidase cbb3-type subunit I/II